jgi:uncharacterized protein DUF6702
MRRVGSVLGAVVALTLVARSGDAHPLHTTLTEVTVDAARHTVRATIRLFADDLAAASASKPATSATLESRATSYAASTFSLTADGRAVPLRSCGVRRASALLWICLEGAVPNEATRLRARDRLFAETFSDQVNIVQRRDATGLKSVVFVKGDGEKPLD